MLNFHVILVYKLQTTPKTIYHLSIYRYNECRDKILPYLKKLGFNTAKDLSFLPVSGQTGQGLLERVTIWYKVNKYMQNRRKRVSLIKRINYFITGNRRDLSMVPRSFLYPTYWRAAILESQDGRTIHHASGG
jgi:translation elongation factor EF-1alpha